jgi:hypothetical protein
VPRPDLFTRTSNSREPPASHPRAPPYPGPVRHQRRARSVPSSLAALVTTQLTRWPTSYEARFTDNMSPRVAHSSSSSS